MAGALHSQSHKTKYKQYGARLDDALNRISNLHDFTILVTASDCIPLSSMLPRSTMYYYCTSCIVAAAATADADVVLFYFIRYFGQSLANLFHPGKVSRCRLPTIRDSIRIMCTFCCVDSPSLHLNFHSVYLIVFVWILYMPFSLSEHRFLFPLVSLEHIRYLGE